MLGILVWWWWWYYREDFVKGICVEGVLPQLLQGWKSQYGHLGCREQQSVLSGKVQGNVEVFAESWIRLQVGREASCFPSRDIPNPPLLLCSCLSQEVYTLVEGWTSVEGSTCYGPEESIMLTYPPPLLYFSLWFCWGTEQNVSSF